MIETLIAFALIALIQLLPLLRRKQKKDLIVALCFYLVPLVLMVLYNLNILEPKLLWVVHEGMQKLGLGYKA